MDHDNGKWNTNDELLIVLLGVFIGGGIICCLAYMVLRRLCLERQLETPEHYHDKEDADDSESVKTEFDIICAKPDIGETRSEVMMVDRSSMMMDSISVATLALGAHPMAEYI